MFDDYKWYAVHTYSGYENKVADNIIKVADNRGMRDQIIEVCVPTETVVEYKDEKRKEYERKLFPGYVLVKMGVFYTFGAGGGLFRLQSGSYRTYCRSQYLQKTLKNVKICGIMY